jgi:putative toxin-antitoxin system antitoxin component (TIGR02293 family)
MPEAIQRVERLLGGRVALGRAIRTELDLADAVREGFPYAVVVEITSGRAAWLTLPELHRFIPRRTLEHRRQAARLTAEQSDRIARIVRLTVMAEDVFGSPDKARDWLRRRTRPLGDQAPLDLLDSDAGASAVENLLGRIAHGIAA